jgi:GxxExxY protein
MNLSGLHFERQVPLAVNYKGVKLDCGYRLDFVVEKTVVVELKAVEATQPIYVAQLLTYLKLGGRTVGLLQLQRARAHEGDQTDRKQLPGSSK